MYRIRLAIVAFLLATIGLQAQEGFYYQAVIKNTDGSPLKETPVKIRIRIIEGTTTLQYEEEKEVTTSREGFVSFIIGEGATTDFTSINWQGELYLQDEIDTGDGYGAPTRMPLLKTPRSYISDRAISVLDNSITSASILDGTISNDDLSAAASISFSKLSISASDIEGLGFLKSDENFTSALKTKLDSIEAGAQVTDATNVEAAGALMDSEVTNLADLKVFDPADYATAAQGTLADSAQQTLTEGAFVDGDKTKLDSIEAGAQVTDATNVEAAGALMDSEVTNLADLKVFDPADYATAAQGTLADSAQQTLTEGAFVDGDKTKLDSIEAGAQVTDATNVEAAGALMDSEVTNLADLKVFDPADYATAAQGTLADSAQQTLTEGAFVDGDKTKLDSIEAGAQVTDATNVEAAGALMDSEVTNLADLKVFDPADYATAAQGTLADSAQQTLTEGAFVDGDKTKLDSIEAGAQVTDATNVEAAGALMDSEVTNLADLKVFDPADYATAAQGTLADSAQQTLTEGAFVDGDKTKLDSIEAGAQVTDATSVEAAGALMDSEVTNLADLKVFDPADYATAAQGTLADSAQQTLTEGAFVDGDKTKLDSIEAGATADQTQADINGLAITEVGAISSGTWNGTAIAITHGGTGATTASAARNSLGIFSGTLNWSENAGAAATEFPFTGIAGVTTSSLIIATIKSQSNGQFLESAIATGAGEITITLSGVPGSNTVLTYIVIN
jgi:uncharacterized protein YqgQ